MVLRDVESSSLRSSTWTVTEDADCVTGRGELMLLLSTPLHQRAASRVQHPNHVAANSLSPPGGKERLHFVGIRPEVQARKGGW